VATSNKWQQQKQLLNSFNTKALPTKVQSPHFLNIYFLISFCLNKIKCESQQRQMRNVNLFFITNADDVRVCVCGTATVTVTGGILKAPCTKQGLKEMHRTLSYYYIMAVQRREKFVNCRGSGKTGFCNCLAFLRFSLKSYSFLWFFFWNLSALFWIISAVFAFSYL